MHLKTKKFVNKDGTATEYVQLVESYRSIEGKPKHRVIASLGRKDDPKWQEKISKLTFKLAEITGIKDLVSLNKELAHVWSKSIGPCLVFRKLWNDLGFNVIFEGEYHEEIFMMVVNRLCDPKSKLSCMDWKETVYEPFWDDIKLHNLYLGLDWLKKSKDRVEVQIFNRTRNLFDQNVDLILFDTTSVSYWGEGDNAPGLLKRGHAKNKRNDLKQLMVGLLMTREGIPVGHEVFPGNQVDVVSFPQVVTKLKERFNIGRIIWVCDRGMISKANLDLLEGLKQEYIIGVKMRQLESGFKAVLLDDHHTGYTKLSKNLFVKVKEVNNKRYIVCYNPEQAEIDATNREYFKQIIAKKVVEKSDKDWIVKNGYRKYLNLKEDIIESVNYDRLEKEKIYDGKWILLTNTSLEYTEIAKHYKSLWQIERAFKELKSTLDLSPIYHWTEKRIRGHIFVCFLALVLEFSFRKALKGESYIKVMSDLKQVQAILSKVRDKEFLKRTELPGRSHLAFRAVQLQIPGINLR